MLGPVFHLQLGGRLRNGNEQLLQVILIQWHLIHVAENAPVDEVAHKSCQACNPVALNLIESHLDMLRCDLCGSVVEGITEMLLPRYSWLRTTLALRGSHIDIRGGGLGCTSIQIRQVNVALTADPARAETRQSIIVTSADGSSHIDLVLRVALG